MANTAGLYYSKLEDIKLFLNEMNKGTIIKESDFDWTEIDLSVEGANTCEVFNIKSTNSLIIPPNSYFKNITYIKIPELRCDTRLSTTVNPSVTRVTSEGSAAGKNIFNVSNSGVIVSTTEPTSGYYAAINVFGGSGTSTYLTPSQYGMITKGSIPISVHTTINSSTRYITIPAATLSNVATTGRTYPVKTTPILNISDGYLYINAGYIENTKISLGTLIPDSGNATADYILNGKTAFGNDGSLITGTMPFGSYNENIRVINSIDTEGQYLNIGANGYYSAASDDCIEKITIPNGKEIAIELLGTEEDYYNVLQNQTNTYNGSIDLDVGYVGSAYITSGSGSTLNIDSSAMVLSDAVASFKNWGGANMIRLYDCDPSIYMGQENGSGMSTVAYANNIDLKCVLTGSLSLISNNGTVSIEDNYKNCNITTNWSAGKTNFNYNLGGISIVNNGDSDWRSAKVSITNNHYGEVEISTNKDPGRVKILSNSSSGNIYIQKIGSSAQEADNYRFRLIGNELYVQNNDVSTQVTDDDGNIILGGERIPDDQIIALVNSIF